MKLYSKQNVFFIPHFLRDIQPWLQTYFILGRKISRRLGRGSGAANNNLAEVVYGMVRARRQRTFR